MSEWLRLAVLLAAACLARPVLAVDAASVAADPVVEQRVKQLTVQLRCLVCQNESIAESSAPLARDLRAQVRRLLAEGRSEAEILHYMTERYGDFVLYRPPLKAGTLVLWSGPFVLLIGGGLGLYAVLRRRARLGDEQFEPDPQGDGSDAP